MPVEAPVSYSVHITHYDDGDIDVEVHDVGSSDADRASVAWALRQAANLVEQGLPISKDMFN